jgi:hypothetical protein
MQGDDRKWLSVSAMHPVFEILHEFARLRGLSLTNTSDKSGGFALAFDGRFIIHVRELGKAATIMAWLGDLPGAQGVRQATLRRLLRAELAGFADDGVVLSLDDETDELYLHRRLPAADLDVPAFERLLKDLLDHVARYRGLLAKPQRLPPPAPMIIRP